MTLREPQECEPQECLCLLQLLVHSCCGPQVHLCGCWPSGTSHILPQLLQPRLATRLPSSAPEPRLRHFFFLAAGTFRLAFARLHAGLRLSLSGGSAGLAGFAVCGLLSPSASTCSNQWWVCLHLCCSWHSSFPTRLFNRHLLCMRSLFGPQRLRHSLHKPHSFIRLSLAAGCSPRNSLMSPGFLRDSWSLKPPWPARLDLFLGYGELVHLSV